MNGLEDYKLPAFTVKYGWNDVKITKLELNCSETSPLDEEVSVPNLSTAIDIAGALFQMVIWHSTFNTVLAASESDDPPATCLPVIINDRLMSFESFMDEFFQSFDGPSDLKVHPLSQKLTFINSIMDSNHWCSSMKWTKEFTAWKKEQKHHD